MAGGRSCWAARRAQEGRYGWRLQAWRRESDFANTSVAVAADRSATTPANDQYETPATGWGVNAALRRSTRDVAGGRLEWELGADARFNEGETRERFRFMNGAFTRDRVAGGETSVAGLYGEGSWSDDLWLVAGGLRLDGLPQREGHAINVYLSGKDGEGAYLAGETTTGSFEWGGKNSSLVLPCRTLGAIPFPVGTITAFWRGRVLVAQGDVLWASRPMAPHLCDWRDFKALQGRITAIQPGPFQPLAFSQ